MDEYRLKRKCWRKHGFSTSREAQREIKRVYRMHHLRVYKYLCSSCGQYHITKDLTAKGKTI